MTWSHIVMLRFEPPLAVGSSVFSSRSPYTTLYLLLYTNVLIKLAMIILKHVGQGVSLFTCIADV